MHEWRSKQAVVYGGPLPKRRGHLAPARLVAAVLLAASLDACSLLFNWDDTVGAPADASGGDVGDGVTGASPDANATPSDAGGLAEAGCPVPSAELVPCSFIPRFTGKQTVDGLPYEFCGLQGVPFNVSQGLDPSPPDASTDAIQTTAVLVTAWDEDGLHLFIQVNQSPVTPPTSYIWFGDAMEVFASANDTLTGYYGAGADEALQVIVAANAQSSTGWSTMTANLPPPLDSNLYTARIVPGGYAVELFLPWKVIAGQTVASPVAGSRIALDFKCDIQGPGGGYQLFSSSLAFNIPPGSSTCGSNPQPACDDRTWCLWTLAGNGQEEQ